MADELTLEIVEGPGAGRQMRLDRSILIGRIPETDLVLDDPQISRRHAKVTPTTDGAALVEDLGSANSTFVNHNEVYGQVRIEPGDELMVGVTVIVLRRSSEVSDERTKLRPVPPALATAPRTPDYLTGGLLQGAPATPAARHIDRYRDARVRRQAQLAPVAIFLLVALALIIYLATR